MPEILRFKNIKICLFFNDHKPAHIHAIKGSAEAKINLTDCECYFSKGFSKKTIKRLETFVEQNKEFLLETWSDYHE